MIEAGTGSGSFSHVLARTVGRVRTGSGEGQGQRVWKGEGNSNRDARDAGGRSRGKKSKAERNAEKQAKAEAAAAAGTTPTDAVASTSTENILDATPAASTSAENGICASDLGSAGEAMPVEPELDANLVPEGEGRVWSFEFHSERVERARCVSVSVWPSTCLLMALRTTCIPNVFLNSIYSPTGPNSQRMGSVASYGWHIGMCVGTALDSKMWPMLVRTFLLRAKRDAPRQLASLEFADLTIAAAPCSSTHWRSPFGYFSQCSLTYLHHGKLFRMPHKP